MPAPHQTDEPHVIKTITAEEIRDVLGYCHWIPAGKGLRSPVMAKFPEHNHASLIAELRAARALRRSDHFTSLEPCARLLRVDFLSDGTCRVVKDSPPPRKPRARRRGELAANERRK